jgi:hypothetical protein
MGALQNKDNQKHDEKATTGGQNAIPGGIELPAYLKN